MVMFLITPFNHNNQHFVALQNHSAARIAKIQGKGSSGIGKLKRIGLTLLLVLLSIVVNTTTSRICSFILRMVMFLITPFNHYHQPCVAFQKHSAARIAKLEGKGSSGISKLK